VRKLGFVLEIVIISFGLHLGNDVTGRLFDDADADDKVDNFSGGNDSKEGGEGGIAPPPASLTIPLSYSSSSQTNILRAISKMSGVPPDIVV